MTTPRNTHRKLRKSWNEPGHAHELTFFWQQGGGYDRNVFQETTAWQCVEYIHANPVRRELCSHPTDWIWSSARWYEGLKSVKLEMDEPPPWPSLTVRGRRKK